MIVKKIKNTKTDKPKAWQIGDLVDYIRFPRNRNPQEKIEHAGGRNFLSATHNGQKVEMIALARESAHSHMPVQHWMFSWQEGEQPTREQVEEVVDIFLEKMGLAGHQTVYGLHYDTDNYHLHIAVNRMNPETGKVVLPFNGLDIREAHKIVARIEHEQGWACEENPMYTVLEDGELARRRTAREIKPKPPALNFEHATGEKSAQRIAQERGHDIIKKAQSWAELHEKLAGVGLRFERKGSGAIIFVGEKAVKASSVDRAFSMGKLCKKLGEFEEGTYPEDLEKIAPEPVSSVNLEEWKTYQEEFAGTPEKMGTAGNVELARMKERHRAERKRALSRLAKYGLPILNIARHCLMAQQRAERLSLRSGRKTVRGGKPRFENWLRARSLEKEAARWRYRKALEEERHAPPSVEEELEKGMETMRELVDFRTYAAAVNAERYRVTCIKMDEDGGKKTFILDKKGGMSRGFSPDELEAHLPEMLRFQRRGENLYYTPLSDDRHHILIDDMTRDGLKRMQEDGFRPAVILESSPGNFQCLLTIPKLGTEHDRDVGNRIHAGIVLNGQMPADILQMGVVGRCRIAGPQIRRLERPALGLPLRGGLRVLPVNPPGQLQRLAAFAALREQQLHLGIAAIFTLMLRLAVLEPRRAVRMDAAAQLFVAVFPVQAFRDAMIALRMRSNGHSRDSVAETIRACAPTIRETQTGRNWQRYAERTADYAFGPAGDRDLERNERYRELWRRVEGTEEKARPKVSMR